MSADASTDPFGDVTVSGNADAGFPPPDPPAETSIAAESAEPESEAAADAAEPEPASEPDPASEAGKELAKKKKSLQSRISELTREKYDSRREADAAKREAAELRQRLAALEQGTPAKTTSAETTPAEAKSAPSEGKPKWADFEAQIGSRFQTWGEAQEAYHDERDAWKDRQVEQQRREADAQRQQSDLDRAIAERVTKFKADHPDYDEVVQAVQVPEGIGTAQLLTHLRHSEVGPQLAYHLAQHPDDLDRIVSLPPVLVVEALGELKAELRLRTKAAPSGPASSAPAKTKATPPIKPVSGSPVAPDDDGDVDDLSETAVNAFVKRESAKIRSRRG